MPCCPILAKYNTLLHKLLLNKIHEYTEYNFVKKFSKFVCKIECNNFYNLQQLILCGILLQLIDPTVLTPIVTPVSMPVGILLTALTAPITTPLQQLATVVANGLTHLKGRDLEEDPSLQLPWETMERVSIQSFKILRFFGN